MNKLELMKFLELNKENEYYQSCYHLLANLSNYDKIDLKILNKEQVDSSDFETVYYQLEQFVYDRSRNKKEQNKKHLISDLKIASFGREKINKELIVALENSKPKKIALEYLANHTLLGPNVELNERDLKEIIGQLEQWFYSLNDKPDNPKIIDKKPRFWSIKKLGYKIVFIDNTNNFIFYKRRLRSSQIVLSYIFFPLVYTFNFLKWLFGYKLKYLGKSLVWKYENGAVKANFTKDEIRDLAMYIYMRMEILYLKRKKLSSESKDVFDPFVDFVEKNQMYFLGNFIGDYPYCFMEYDSQKEIEYFFNVFEYWFKRLASDENYQNKELTVSNVTNYIYKITSEE